MGAFGKSQTAMLRTAAEQNISALALEYAKVAGRPLDSSNGYAQCHGKGEEANRIYGQIMAWEAVYELAER